MPPTQHLFIGGLHKSGTSLLHRMLRSHPAISAFENTGVSEEEGQHLQNVYPPAHKLGGPGRFGFHRDASMDETHPLCTKENAAKLFAQWSPHWDLSKDYLLEKSPPNLLRTRFLQGLFPDSTFLILLRHPVAVAYATRKWCRSSLPSLLEHTLHCYERFREDQTSLSRVHVLRYEELVNNPVEQLTTVFTFLGQKPHLIDTDLHSGSNAHYFAQWVSEIEQGALRPSPGNKDLTSTLEDLESRAKAIGYSLGSPAPLP